MGHLPNAVRANFGRIINLFHEDANKETILWQKSLGGLDRFGEDNATETFTNINLKVLFDYNIFRTWPLNTATDSGNIDKQSVMMIINRKYLSDEGHTDVNGRFDFNPDADRFVYRGIEYMAEGDTMASQASNALGEGDPLHVYIILKRQNKATGT